MVPELQRSLSTPVPWKEMFRTISLSKSGFPANRGEEEKGLSTDAAAAAAGTVLVTPSRNKNNREQQEQEECAATAAAAAAAGNTQGCSLEWGWEMEPGRLSAINLQLALYIALAHAGLLLLIATLYGLGLLLHDFWKPIQWAVLCSITLRQIQGTLVRFWDAPLRQGLLQTLLAVPLAVCRAIAGTIRDARNAGLWICGRSEQGPVHVGFLKLFELLVTFAALTLGYEWLGPRSLVTGAFTGLMIYAFLCSFGFFEDEDDAGPSSPPVESSKQVKRARRKSVPERVIGWATFPLFRLLRLVNKHSTRYIARRLPTIIAIGLIVVMILGCIAGMVIFSYKVGLESRDAVVALKHHVEQSNYTEMMGLSQWLESSNLEQYAAKLYGTVSQQIDSFAVQYNLTEFSDAGKEFVLRLARAAPNKDAAAAAASPVAAVSSHPVLLHLQNARASLGEYDFSGMYSELEAAFLMLLDHLQLTPDDVKARVKQLSETGAGIGKKVFSGGSVLASLMLSAASSIASGAAGVFNFITQAAVFVSLLYYLITSEAGGVMEQVLAMVPLPQATRVRCAAVLNRAVSSVLLATLKSAFFQAAFTFLLFRFFSIHFLYVSTLLSIVVAVLPVLPHWLPSLPAVAQLALQGDYILAALLLVLHSLVLDMGNRAIHNEIPGHNAYLAGLSIAGGMALFSPALEGAIMGPLLMTVLIAFKNLYSEFLLNSAAVR